MILKVSKCERENNAAQIDKYSSTVKVRASQDRMLKEPRS